MTPYEVIKDAILNRKTVRATYQGHPREMCPHVIGLNKRGEQQALCYQFGGTSSSGLGPDGSAENWRCVRIAGLRDVTSTDGPWHTAPDHSRPQTCVARRDVEVTF